MKENQLPDCYVEANDNHFVCYVMEYDDEEHMDYEERYVGNMVEVIKTCRICGQTDIYYPA